jgi:hypothetical protein
LSKVTGLGTGDLPSAPVCWGRRIINEAQLGHRLGSLGEMDMDPTEDKVDHTLAAQAATTDLICLPSSESNFQYGREVYMVEQGHEPLEKTIK